MKKINIKKININILYPILLFLFLIILKYPTLNLPYYWDALNYVIPTINYVYNNTFTPFLWDYSLGHPPFFFWFVATLFKIFGSSKLVAHSSVVLFSFLTLYFTYLIGKKLFNRKVGIIASLILLFTPIFFSYSGLLLLAIPLTALTTITIYFAIKSKPLLYFIFGSLAILTKIPGVVIIAGITLAKLIREKKINKNVIMYALPFLTFLVLVISNKVHYGYFLYPISTSLLQLYPLNTLLNSLIILKTIFFDQYRWILTSFFIISFIKFKEIKIRKFPIILTILFFLLLYNINIFTDLLSSSFPNIGNYFNIVKTFSLLFAILFFLLLLSYKNIIKKVAKKRYLGITIPFLLILLFFIFIIPTAPRYILPLFPITFLFFAFAINKLFKKYGYLVALMIIIIFSLNFTGERSTVGFALETNMEYTDSIETHLLGASYIEKNFPGATVLAAFPLSSELKYPYGSYVKNPINVVTHPPFPGIIGNKKNYTIYLDPELSQEELIDISSIDFYYYSPQEFPTKNVLSVANQLNLTLVKKFELNNKSTEIYLVNE